MVRIQYFTNFVLNEIEEKHKNIYLDLVVSGKLKSPVTLVFVCWWLKLTFSQVSFFSVPT